MRHVALPCLLLLIGCPAPEPRPEPGPARPEQRGPEVGLEYRALVEGVATPSTSTCALRLDLIELERFPEDALEPLSVLTRAVLTLDDPPVRAAPRLLAGGRAAWLASPETLAAWLSAGRAGAARRLPAPPGVLTPGVVAEYVLARGLQQAELRVGAQLLETAPPRLQLSLELRAATPPLARQRELPPSELLLLEPRALEEQRGGFAAVLPLPGAEGGAVAVLLEVGPAPAPGTPGAERHLAALLAREEVLAASAASTAAPGLAQGADGSAPAAARQALADAVGSAGRRWALAALAEGCGARLAAELALTADEPLLAAVQTRLLAGAGPVLGWEVERAALDALLEELSAGATPPWARPLLILYAGGVGLDPARLRECAAGASDTADLRRRLAQANQDLRAHPSAWVRACADEWLSANVAAAPGPEVR